MGKQTQRRKNNQKIKMFRNILQKSQILTQLSQRGLRKAPYREERIVTNEDGSVIVCWHPEPKFPYEFTQPIPRNIPTEQTMQVQAIEDMKELYHHKPERFARRDLMRLTWTSKHRWFGKSRAQQLRKVIDIEKERKDRGHF